MLRSTKMFVEQSHLTMPSPVWLHINGVSLTTDIHPYQPPVHAYDYRTKHLQSPVQPLTPPLPSPSAIVPCSITVIDGPFSNYNTTNNRNYKKLENTDTPKKIFIDRQIKKAKSLPGLIKGTALSRHTPLQSSAFTNPVPLNPSTNNIQDDQLPIVTLDNDDDSLPMPQPIEIQIETRRPRVYFADFNKIQFIEDNNDLSQQQQHIPINYSHRRHRRRASKKTSNTNGNNYVSPSIQQTQILQNYSRPLSRQSNHQIAQELSIKKQQLLISPRAQSSRTIHLPDILNQSLPIELSSNENSNGKYVLQREKPISRLPKPIIEIPMPPATDISSDDTHTDIAHSLIIHDSHIPTHESESSENNNGMSLQGTPSLSSTLSNRQRPSLRTISLRQQFISPIKLKPTAILSTTNNNHNQQMNNSILNARRSTSLKQSTPRTHDDNNDNSHLNNKSLITIENRPMTSTRSVKQLKRSDIIHFNSKNPLGGNTTNESNKSHLHDSTQERFQNLLTIVRPPYAISSIIPNDSTIQPINHNHTNGNFRSSRSTSARGSSGFRLNSSTVIV